MGVKARKTCRTWVPQQSALVRITAPVWQQGHAPRCLTCRALHSVGTPDAHVLAHLGSHLSARIRGAAAPLRARGQHLLPHWQMVRRLLGAWPHLGLPVCWGSRRSSLWWAARTRWEARSAPGSAPCG